MAIAIDGTGTITGISVGGLNDSIITSSELANGAVTAAKIGYAGAILQVVQVVKTDTTSTSAQDTFEDLTGLSQAITPSSSSSKILVTFSLGRVDSNTSNIRLSAFRILRGSTPIGVGDAAGSRLQANFTVPCNFGSEYGMGISYSYLDSPATTSSTTYKLQWTGQAGETWYLNRSAAAADSSDVYTARTGSSLILMEVAG